MKEILFISLIHLIQHPEMYDEKQVRVIAPASLRFERQALYASADDLNNAVTKNAIWLDFKLTPEVQQLHHKYVIVEGTFDRHRLGHLKLYSGTIKSITRIEEWKKD